MTSLPLGGTDECIRPHPVLGLGASKPTLAQRTRKKWGTRGEAGWNEIGSNVI